MKKEFIFGPIQMLFSAIVFAIMTYTAKLASTHIPGAEVSFFRLSLGTVTFLILVLIRQTTFRSNNTKLLLSRGIFGGIAVLLYFASIEKGTITNSTVLQNTYVIFSAILGMIILKEKLTFRMIVALILSMVGIIALTQPNFTSIKVADILALTAGFVAGIAITAVRQLRKRDESAWLIFFYFCFFGMVVSFLFALPVWKWPNNNEYILLLLTGILGLLGQVSMTSAYKYCKAAVGGIISMTTIIFTALLGIFFLGERLTIFEIIGAIMIFIGCILVVARSNME
ncbi:MAG: DMT family transporter [Ignavibacteriales bacterium]